MASHDGQNITSAVHYDNELTKTEDSEKTPEKRTSKKKLFFALFLVVVTVVALGVGIGLSVAKEKDNNETKSQPVNVSMLVDCYPDEQESREGCEKRGCIWANQGENNGRPNCVFPERYGYKMADWENIPNGVVANLTRIATPPLFGQTPYESLTVLVEYQTDNRLRIKIYPPGEDRFEVPDQALNTTFFFRGTTNTTRLYDVTFQSEPVFGVVVTRRSTNVTIFNTSVPGMAYYDQFLQITTQLHNSYIYGFGEHRHETFRHDMNYRKWSIFTRDAGPDSNWNLYGAHPVYMNVEDDGQANMVFLKNSNAMEVVLQPDPAITFRTIGGILDFYIFLGNSPGHAVSLYTEMIGRPVLPPYWALGYQLSRWGYTNITDMQMVIERNRAAQIPYDVQWGDIDLFYKQNVFTYDRELWANLSELVDDLHANHQHFVIIVDPGVGANETVIAEVQMNSPRYNMYYDGQVADIFVKNSTGGTLIGEVWPGLTAYPDYTNESIVDWYEKYVRFYRENESVKVDALWIDMNEPASFVPGSLDGCLRTRWDYPPYVPNILGADDDGKMFDKTICMTAIHAWGPHYDVHSLYAHAMAMRTNEVLKRVFPGKRPWTMTRSSFAGTGHYATKWMGDNQATWPAMHWSIIGIMEFSTFGFALNGADICGFWYETTYEMCIRWHQLGAFYPFARNHNGKGDPPVVFKHQDPASFDQRFIDIIKQPLMTRYRLLPYLYSLMFRATLYGDTVMRPLLFEFTQDLQARDIDRQFLLGPALLLSPVLEPSATSVEAYFPEARWFEYFTGEEVTSVGQINTLETPMDKFNVHLRGGHVIPWQTPALTTYKSRQNDMGLLVVLNEAWRAEGDLYLDDGESEVNESSYSYIVFTMKKAGELFLEPRKMDYNTSLAFTTVEIFGLPTLPREVIIDGDPLPQHHIRYFSKVVQLINLHLPVLQNHTITWSVY